MARGMNWGMVLERRAQSSPNALALIAEDRKITYAELNVLTKQTANWLSKLGTRKGDRVCVYLENAWEHVVAHLGILRRGGVVVPLNAMYKTHELQYILKDSEAATVVTNSTLASYVAEARAGTLLKHVIVTDGASGTGLPFQTIHDQPEVLEDAVDLDEREDLALIQYTSGTTGAPKGAMLTYHNVFANLRTSTNLNDFNNSDVQLLVLPLFHSFGIFSLYSSLFSGGLVVLMKRFHAERAMALISHHRVTRFYCVPPMLLGLLDVPAPKRYDLSSLKHCLCGAAVLPVEVMRRTRELLGVDVVDGYGSTEAYAIITTPYGGLYKHGSIGIPSPAQEVRLVGDDGADVPVGKVGEIVTRGPFLMKGYFKKPEATKEAIVDGWFHTGDLATRDDDGYYYIAGRKKDMIICSGFNVYPKEVEELLYHHPKVADAAVIGVPHEYKGEAVKAVVVPKDGESLTQDEIIEYCRAELAVFKAPTAVEFVKELPRNASGKILKRVLRDLEASRS